MKIALLNLPWNVGGRDGVRAGSRWPHLKDNPESDYLPFPFFLAYSASLLERKGCTALLIDAICDELSEEEVARRLQQFKPDMIVAETSTVTAAHDVAMLSRLPRARTMVLCGPDTTIRSPHFLHQYGHIDIVIKGEYEYALAEVAEHLARNGALDTIAGINFRRADGSVVINAPRPLDDIAQLPWPRREGLNLTRYVDAPGELPFPTLQMLASRGCPYRCLFCLWPQVMYGGATYRMRPVNDVLDEMEAVVARYQFRSVYFDDDTFGLNQEWLNAFAVGLIRRNIQGRINVPWAMMTRPDVLTPELLRKLKHSGLWAVKYGMESGCQHIVDRSGKNLDLAYAKRIIRLTHRLGIKTHLTFTVGLPGETWRSVKKTIRTAIKLNPYSVQFSITTPFPGTAYHALAEQEGTLLSKQWDDYDGNTKSVIRTKTLGPDDLVRARALAYATWNRYAVVRRIVTRRPGHVINGMVRVLKDGRWWHLLRLVMATMAFSTALAVKKIRS